MLYMIFADGFEETEAIASLDVIRRSGIEIKTAGLTKTVTGTHNIPITCDITVNEAVTDGLAGIILPGGMPGTDNLYQNEKVRALVTYCADNNLLLAAICAAPSIFGRMGLLKGKKAICFPGFEDMLTGAELYNRSVCTDGNIITAKAMGAAIDFGLEIVKYLLSEEAASEIKQSIFYR